MALQCLTVTISIYYNSWLRSLILRRYIHAITIDFNNLVFWEKVVPCHKITYSCVYRYKVRHSDGYGAIVNGAWNGMVGDIVRQVFEIS